MHNPGTDSWSAHAIELLRRADNLVAAILSFKRLGWLKSEREDYRQDVLLSLIGKLKKLDLPGVEPIKDYDAYVAQSGLNQYRRRQRARLSDPAFESLDSYLLTTPSTFSRATQEEALIAG
jgi:hypothetical protein